MAKIVTITNPLTGQPAQVDQLEHTAQQIDDGLNIARNVSNPNLLDNWYFGNPVNQRGQTSYTGAGYGIDRWNMNGDTGTILLQDGVVELVLSAGYQTLNQDIENPLNFRGKTVTASILVESLNGGSFSLMAYDGADYYGHNTRITTPGVHSLTFTVDKNATTLRILMQNRSETETLTVKVQAVKLELGSQQTLAHQDENGNWVLNEIPDYREQLARCQRYFQKYDNHIWFTLCKDNVWRASFTFPVAMREAPTVEFETISDLSANVVFDNRTKNGISGYASSSANYIAVKNLTLNANL